MKKTFEPALRLTLFPCLALSLSLTIAIASNAQSSPPVPVPNAQLADRQLNAKVDALLKQMTLEEKIGQTVQYSAGFATGPEGSKLSYDELTQRGALGSMLNVYGAEKTNHYQHIAMEKSRLHIPLIFGWSSPLRKH